MVYWQAQNVAAMTPNSGSLPANGTQTSAGYWTNVSSGVTNLHWEDQNAYSGSGPGTLTITTAASTAAQRTLIGRWVSRPLAVNTSFDMGSIAELSVWGDESNAASNFIGEYVIFLYRPSTQAVITTVASGTLGTEFTGGQVYISAGTINAFTSQDGDVLILEIGRDATTQAMATAYTNTLKFDDGTSYIYFVVSGSNPAFRVEKSERAGGRPTLVGARTNSANGAITSANTPTLPTGWQPGDLAVVTTAVGWTSAQTAPSEPSGWTTINTGGLGRTGLRAMYRFLQAGDTTWTQTFGGTVESFAMRMTVWRGVTSVSSGGSVQFLDTNSGDIADAVAATESGIALVMSMAGYASTSGWSSGPSNATIIGSVTQTTASGIQNSHSAHWQADSTGGVVFDPGSVLFGSATSDGVIALWYLNPGGEVSPIPAATGERVNAGSTVAAIQSSPTNYIGNSYFVNLTGWSGGA